MSGQEEIPDKLRVARRALESLTGFRLIEDWAWYEGIGKWSFRCSLSPVIGRDDLGPAEHEWSVVVGPSYPWGYLKIFPANAGLQETYWHQMYNGSGREDLPWRTGELCLTTPLRTLGRQGYDVEPHSVSARLRWHVERALGWLKAAANGSLTSPGDPFELPDFPIASDETRTVAFSEGSDSYRVWQGLLGQSGTATLCSLRAGLRPLLVVRSFIRPDGKLLLEPSWGKTIADAQAERFRSIWIALRTPPILPPWQAPATWEELRRACLAQEVDMDALLRRVTSSVRDGRAHLALVGFPIPEVIGSQAKQMHWQAFQLPVLSHGNRKANGFRANEDGYWRRDRLDILKGDRTLGWLTSENWHPDQIVARGRLAATIRRKRVLVLGGGALGSVVAELLVRGGVLTPTIMDGDPLEVGNLVRHTLDLGAVKFSKATTLARHLEYANPHATVNSLSNQFQAQEELAIAAVHDCELIVDCTAQDEVLYGLATIESPTDKLFVSLSVGHRARRLFCFASWSRQFPQQDFHRLLRPWLEQEAEESEGQMFPREGIGCWHPVFPARADDIWLLAAAGAKYIEEISDESREYSTLVVFEQCYIDGHFSGVRRVG